MDEVSMIKVGILLVIFGVVLSLSPVIAKIVTLYEYVTYVFYIIIGCGIGLIASTQVFERSVEQVRPSPSISSSKKTEKVEEEKEVEEVGERKEEVES